MQIVSLCWYKEIRDKKMSEYNINLSRATNHTYKG